MIRPRFAVLAGAVALVASASSAQAQSAAIPVTANVQTPLTVTKTTNLDFTTVFPGVTKTVSPQTNGAASATAGLVTVQGQSNGQVTVSFVMPSPMVLNGPSGATLPLSFSATSGCWGASNTQSACTPYDAATTLTQRLSGTGFMHVWLGGTVAPAVNQTAGAYTATITMNVAYTGL